MQFWLQLLVQLPAPQSLAEASKQAVDQRKRAPDSVRPLVPVNLPGSTHLHSSPLTCGNALNERNYDAHRGEWPLCGLGEGSARRDGHGGCFSFR